MRPYFNILLVCGILLALTSSSKTASGSFVKRFGFYKKRPLDSRYPADNSYFIFEGHTKEGVQPNFIQSSEASEAYADPPKSDKDKDKMKGPCVKNPCTHGVCKEVDKTTFQCTCEPGWGPPNCSGPAAVPQMTGPEPKKGGGGGNSMLPLIIGGGVVVLLIAGIAIYWFCCRKKDDDDSDDDSDDDY
eukprot:Platyproteum_vivax@DN1900_c0_g1_i1.p1